MVASPPAGPQAGEPTVRELRTLSEYRACVALQREVWGNGFAEAVPASLLKIAQEVGGVTAGAFTASGELVGFVHGLTGVRRGRLTHWSHMLAVRASHRGHGIGFRLKLFQRHRLLDRGVHEMRWTFDPLVAANAHFNLNVLGVRVEGYVPDMYGETGSGIHAAGTDRFISLWKLVEAPGPRTSAVDAAVWSRAPVLNGSGGRDLAGWEALAGGAPAVRIVIPREVFRLERDGPDSQREWRRGTRDAFLRATSAGYRVVGFSRDGDVTGCHYHLSRTDSG